MQGEMRWPIPRWPSLGKRVNASLPYRLGKSSKSERRKTKVLKGSRSLLFAIFVHKLQKIKAIFFFFFFKVLGLA